MAKDVFLQSNIPTQDFSEAVRKLLDQPRFQGSLLPALWSERETRKTLVKCLPESERLKTNDLRAGKREICLYRAQTGHCSGDLILNAENNAQNSLTAKAQLSAEYLDVNGCLSAILSFGISNGNHGCQITKKSTFVQSKIIQVSWSARQQYSYRNARDLNCRIVEATLENKCGVCYWMCFQNY